MELYGGRGTRLLGIQIEGERMWDNFYISETSIPLFSTKVAKMQQ